VLSEQPPLPPAKSGGRHRAPTPRRNPWPTVIGVVVVVLVLPAAGWWWQSQPAADDGAAPHESLTQTPARTPSPSPSPSAGTTPPARVESERVVRRHGTQVVVEEKTRLVAGGSTRALPANGAPQGLELIRAETLGADGRNTNFDDAVEITSGGTLTVRGTYRLTHCPDILPTTWPSPVSYPHATRRYVRVDEPLRTASALCPRAPSRASTPKSLHATVVSVRPPVVRLSWRGDSTLTIDTVGSASGVAVLVPKRQCNTSCVARLAPGHSARLQLQPVDPCPPATHNDRLTLVVSHQHGGRTTVAARAPRLHNAVCH
jgi:hypothetical protein